MRKPAMALLVAKLRLIEVLGGVQAIIPNSISPRHGVTNDAMTLRKWIPDMVTEAEK